MKMYEKFDMTRQAISLHVKIPEECGLLVIRQSGRDICAWSFKANYFVY